MAIDVTSLIGLRTGVGNAVAATFAALTQHADPPRLIPYALSLRAREHRSELPDNTVFPPVPAGLALKAWTRAERPRIDRWLDPADVLHATNYLTPPSSLPTVVTIHDCAFVRYPELASDDARTYKSVIQRAIRRGATAHTPSEFVAHEVDEIFGPGLIRAGRVVVIPWGIPSVLRDLGLSDPLREAIADRPFVLSLGTVEPRKNLPHLVAAFGRAANDHADLVLVIAGPDGSAGPALDAAITRLPQTLRDRVLRVGAVNDRDRSSLLHRAAVLAYPSISEGFGFPVLEAMIAGTPVVAARAGSIPEIAGDAARLVDATDEDALAAALLELMIPDVGSDYVRRGFVQAAQFDWTTTATRLVELYRDMT